VTELGVSEIVLVTTQNSNAEYDDDDSLASLVSNLYVCFYVYIYVFYLHVEDMNDLYVYVYMIYVKTQNSNAEYDDDDSLASLVSNLYVLIYV
jgi:hypothetical protein